MGFPYFGQPAIFGEPFGMDSGGAAPTLAERFTAHILSIKPAGLIFFAPLNETSGTTANDLSAQNNDGTYRTATMLNKGTFLTGEPCPQFVPASGDYVNLPAGFFADFNLDEYCIVQFLRVRNAGVWSDGTVRTASQMRRDNDNRSQISRTTTNNQLRFFHSAGGTVDAVFATLSTTDWFMATQRVSRSEDTMKAYINDAQVGTTQTGIGTAAGAIGTAVIGAAFVPSTDTWDGFEAYTVVWSGAGNLPSDAEIASIWDFLAA